MKPMEPPSHPLKILILDDSGADREMCRRLLSRAAPPDTYEFIGHDRLAGAAELARAEKPACILLDYSLRDGTGIDFLRGLPEWGGPMESAVVMLTGMGSELIAAESIKAGAQDYLVKSHLTPEMLRCTVESAICAARIRYRLEEQHRERERALRELQDENIRKERFLATLSHDLRTPLTPVLIAAGILRDSHGHSVEVQRIAALILKNAELQARVLDGMLGPVIPKPFGS